MPMESLSSAQVRAQHPVTPELVGGLELSVAGLNARPVGVVSAALAQMLANAEYWLSFDLASFEPLLSKCPSPLRELGVAVALRYGDQMSGELGIEDLEAARVQLLPSLGADLKDGVAQGLRSLEKAVRARDAVPGLEARGYRPYRANTAMSVQLFRFSGSCTIHLQSAPEEPDRPSPLEGVDIGVPFRMSATDESGKLLAPPELETRVDAPLLARDDDSGGRSFVVLVPGEYRARVAGREKGERTFIVS